MPPTHPNQVDRIQSVDAESFSLLNELARAFRSGESNPRPSHFPVLEGIRAVLAHLQFAGRLIPAGGMALTAEQVEDVRTVADSFAGMDPEFPSIQAAARLRALLPETEPAEPVVECRGCVRDECLDCAPAEPAEEETEAEGPCVVRSPDGDVCEVQSGHAGVHTWAWPDKKVASSPAETESWQRIEDVPETVGRLTDRDGDVWEWDGDNWVTPETAILSVTYINKNYAPFVAAEEG